MLSWTNSIVIHAPADKVFAYVDDTSTLIDWFPSLVDVRNLVGSGVGQRYEWTYKMAGMLLSAQGGVVEHVPNEFAVHQSSGMIQSTFKYAVEPHQDGSVLTIELKYNVPVPVLGRLAEHIVIGRNTREFELALINVKELLEA